MSSPDDDLTLDCRTCVAANTTACSECVVNHLLANDDGPIRFVPTPAAEVLDHTDRAIALFGKAGLLDAEPVFVPASEFDTVEVPLPAR